MKLRLKYAGAMLLGILFCFSAKAGKFISGNEIENRDTAMAVVVYDSKSEVLPIYKYTAIDYKFMIDSLKSLDSIPINQVKQLKVYADICSKNENELMQLVDSLFEQESVPKDYLNTINTYLAFHSQWTKIPKAISDFVPYDTTIYPANSLYGSWNISKPHPYSSSLLRADEARQLMLADSATFCGYVHPFEGIVTSQFGYRYFRNHNGIDVDLEVGDPVRSAFAGMVRVAKTYAGYGRVVVVRHYNGLETLYAHLHRLKVKPGDLVEAGDIVGLGGSSGNSTGSHLHFEVRYKGVPVNPASIIDFKNYCLINNFVEVRKSAQGIAVIPEGVQFYSVKKNDYLYKIAQTFGVSVAELCDLNGIARNSILKVGQKLRISS